MATTNLLITELTGGQANKVTTINDALNSLDEAMTDYLSFTIVNAATDTMTAAESKKNMVIDITGTLSQDCALDVDGDEPRIWVVRDSTTSGFRVTFKTDTGTGVVLQQGKWMLVFSDGTNMVEGFMSSVDNRVAIGTTSGTVDIDWREGAIRTVAITAAFTATFSNYVQGDAILLEVSGNFTFTLPGDVEVLSGSYDGSATKNYIQLYCNDSSTPEFLATISSI